MTGITDSLRCRGISISLFNAARCEIFVENRPQPTAHTTDDIPTKLKKKIQSIVIIIIGVRYDPNIIPPYMKLMVRPDNKVFSLSEQYFPHRIVSAGNSHPCIKPWTARRKQNRYMLISAADRMKQLSTPGTANEIKIKNFESIYKVYVNICLHICLLLKPNLR